MCVNKICVELLDVSGGESGFNLENTQEADPALQP